MKLSKTAIKGNKKEREREKKRQKEKKKGEKKRGTRKRTLLPAVFTCRKFPGSNNRFILYEYRIFHSFLYSTNKYVVFTC